MSKISPHLKQKSRQPRVKTVPDWSVEESLGGYLVAGVDEAGRGSLAGPVVAAAVILNPMNIPAGLNDSKALSNAKRIALFRKIQKSTYKESTYKEITYVGIGIAEPEEVDRTNILAATMCAMQRAVADLPVLPNTVLIDGNRCPDLPMPAQAIVKGDAKSLSIAAASIIAKTTRDRLMIKADDRFLGYGHAGHKGYPTKTHKQALIERGVSPIHRWSFGPVRDAWS